MTDLILEPPAFGPNYVDTLLAQIVRIQAACTHRFVRMTPISLRESLLAGVHIGEADHGNHGPEAVKFTVQCKCCSLEVPHSVLQRCPECLSKMKRGAALEPRERYRNPNALRGNYAARVYSCTKAGCTVKLVIDELDSRTFGN